MFASEMDRTLWGWNMGMQAHVLIGSQDGGFATRVAVLYPTLGLTNSGIERLDPLAVYGLQAP